VEGSIPGQDIPIPTGDGQGTVTLVGIKDAASAMPADASRLFAKNVANLLALMTRDGVVVPDFEDEVIAGTCLTHNGQVLHAPTAEALAALAGEAAPLVGGNAGASGASGSPSGGSRTGSEPGSEPGSEGVR
jgi:NAD(P) transhydrogenase subunit alpha